MLQVRDQPAVHVRASHQLLRAPRRELHAIRVGLETTAPTAPAAICSEAGRSAGWSAAYGLGTRMYSIPATSAPVSPTNAATAEASGAPVTSVSMTSRQRSSEGSIAPVPKPTSSAASRTNSVGGRLLVLALPPAEEQMVLCRGSCRAEKRTSRLIGEMDPFTRRHAGDRRRELVLELGRHRFHERLRRLRDQRLVGRAVGVEPCLVVRGQLPEEGPVPPLRKAAEVVTRTLHSQTRAPRRGAPPRVRRRARESAPNSRKRRPAGAKGSPVPSAMSASTRVAGIFHDQVACCSLQRREEGPRPCAGSGSPSWCPPPACPMARSGSASSQKRGVVDTAAGHVCGRVVGVTAPPGRASVRAPAPVPAVRDGCLRTAGWRRPSADACRRPLVAPAGSRAG